MGPRLLVLFAAFASLTTGAQPQSPHVYLPHAFSGSSVASLKKLVADFRNAHRVQLTFVEDDQSAQFSYGFFQLLGTPGGFKLQTRYRAPTAMPINLLSRFADTRTDLLFYDVIEQSLFNEVNGLYRPVVVVRCVRKDVTSVDIAIAKTNGLGLEGNLTYQLGEQSGGAHIWHAPVLLSAGQLDHDGASRALFTVDGVVEVRKNFFDGDCVGKPPRPIVLVPLLQPPLNRGSVNQ